ncbi:hypothetical protein DICPUDRAFT_74017 [Dictyostelium purpureum]|uniref:RING-type domain-containing protein n=1 Tax=Dictyostelium purpureum TaxID=5786 RepID=F0Z6I8_DICPU|nr:uncharacterized protein DICPUDRAFT_74017 [Dictyostelium purpureum]EGC40448.1 hypothetical protein DICPUDRAFT_74017 [Dictyostelium purpureum]|eukprot:XP_003282995.1 hypothetical protein DICPUDRAFT_74017 [Dictyostelium purpureum]
MEIIVGEIPKKINILDIIAIKESEVEEELVCSICANIMIDPTSSLLCSSHVFCKACLVKWLEKSQSCPTCRCEVPKDTEYALVLKVEFEDKINNIKVHCPYAFKDDSFEEIDHDHGCKEIITVSKFRQHINQCIYQFKKICGMMRLYEMHNHYEKECPYVILECIYCSKQYRRGNTESHLKKCQKVLVECGNGCIEKFARSEIEQHSKDCPNRIVECQFKDFGCTDTFKFGQYKEHSSLYDNHRDFLFKKVEVLSLQVCSLNNQIMTFKETIDEQNSQISQLRNLVLKRKVLFFHQSLLEKVIKRKSISVSYSSKDHAFDKNKRYYYMHLNKESLDEYSNFDMVITIGDKIILDVKDQCFSIRKEISYEFEFNSVDNSFLQGNNVIKTFYLHLTA